MRMTHPELNKRSHSLLLTKSLHKPLLKIKKSTSGQYASKLSFIKQKLTKQSGMILVFVLIFLLAISLLAVSSISSSKLQLTLLNNQQMYLQAIIQLENAQEFVFSQLTKEVYSEKILNLESIWDEGSELLVAHSSTMSQCDITLDNHWIQLDLTGELPSAINALSNIKTHLSVISTEVVDNQNSTVDMGVSTKRLETLLIKQCLGLGNSGLWVLQTSIITRRSLNSLSINGLSSNRFSISSIYHNSDIILAGN